MVDSRLKHPEWRLQPLFIKSLILAAFLLILSNDSSPRLPDRQPMPERAAALRLEPLAVKRDAGGGFMVTGAWTLTADDPRVMGLSALAVLPGGRLQAMSDSGALISFPRPGSAGPALVGDLPGGPGYPTFKKYRDSEAMVVDPDGRGRLVAFENQHSLWRFTDDGTATRVPVALPSERWKANKGIEAMVREGGGGSLLLLPESGRQLLRIAGSPTPERHALDGASGGIADAVRLPDGRIMVAVREVGLLGLTNRLAWLERTGRGYRLRNVATLPLGPLDNVEGLAAERGANGQTVIWAITDNDGWRRTVLMRLELDTTKAPAEAGA